MSDTIRIRYLGHRLPKFVDLPIPFVSNSEKVGQVKCDPVGEFPIDDGERLLEISGEQGLFVVENDGVEKAHPELNLGPLCVCGCGERIVIKPHHKHSGIPKYILGHFKPKTFTVPKPSKVDETDRPGDAEGPRSE